MRDDLNERARQAYVQGPGSGRDILLEASSFAEPPDRLEFVGEVTQADSDLATEVENLRNELLGKEQRGGLRREIACPSGPREDLWLAAIDRQLRS